MSLPICIALFWLYLSLVDSYKLKYSEQEERIAISKKYYQEAMQLVHSGKHEYTQPVALMRAAVRL